MDVRLLQTGLVQARTANSFYPGNFNGFDFEAFSDSLMMPPPVVEVLWKPATEAPAGRPKPGLAEQQSLGRNSTTSWWVSPMSRETSSCSGGLNRLVQNCGEQVVGLVVVSVLFMVLAYLFLWLSGPDKRSREARGTCGEAPRDEVLNQDVSQRRGWGPGSPAPVGWKSSAAKAWQEAEGGVDWLRRPFPVLLLVLGAHWTCFGTLAACVADMVLQQHCLAMGLAGDVCAASAEAQAATATSVSWLSMLIALPALVALPLLGHLSDVVGRKPVLLLATAQGTIFYSILAFRGAYDTGTLAALAALGCLGNVLVVEAVVCAAVCDLCASLDEVARVRLLGLALAPIWVGQLLGPFLGSTVGSTVGPQRSFLVPAILCGGLFPAIVMFFPETLATKGRETFTWHKAQLFGVLRAVQTHERCLVLAIGLVFAETGTSVGVATWPHFLRSMFGWADASIGALQAVFCACNVLALALLLPRAAACSGPRRILLTSAGCSSLLWMLHWVAIASWQMFVIVPLGALTALMHPPLRAIVAQEFGPRSYGLAMGAPLLLLKLSHVAAAPISRALWHWSKAARQPDGITFMLPTMTYIVAFVVLCLLPPKAQVPASP